jgi:hypothetical protein
MPCSLAGWARLISCAPERPRQTDQEGYLHGIDTRNPHPSRAELQEHDARHSFSTALDHAGVSESRGGRYMGHSTGSVSGRNRHLLPGQIADDRQAFDEYLGGVTSGKVIQLAAAG